MTFSGSLKARAPKLAAILLGLACVSLSFSCAANAQRAAQNPPGRVGRLALIDGTVTYHTADEQYWQAARRNYPVTTGQSFWTEPGSHAGIEIGSNRIYLNSSTELDVSTLDDTAAQFSLPQGAVFLILTSFDQAKPYETHLARGTVTLTAAGRYEVIAGDTEHDSQMTVLEGSAHISGNGFSLDVHAGEMVILSGTDIVRAEVRAAGPPDAFVAWVETQDQRHRPQAPAVVSAITGAAELGDYGRWAKVADYGDVWYPNVSADWVPYRKGYWGWVEPWGWSWVDEEAWGFAPFHYGRWLVMDDRWAWIPEAVGEPIAPIYAPALVAFFTTGDLCAWVPLAPDEAYVPPYPVSPGYFQTINAGYVRGIRNRGSFTNKTNINAFVNQRAVTAVPRSVVSRSQPVAAHAQSGARLADARPVQGAAALRPTAATAGISPSVARRFGIASGAVASAHAQAHAPGPPVRSVAPAANARLAPPRTVAAVPQHGRASTTQSRPAAPALPQPGAIHHLPGSRVGETGGGAENRPSGAPARSVPPAVAHRPEAPAARAVPAPETSGRPVTRAPSAASARPTPPPAAHTTPRPPSAHAAAQPRPPTTARHAPQTPRAVVHAPPPPTRHAAPAPTTTGRASPPHAPTAPARPPAAPVVRAPPPAAHAAPPATVGRAPPAPAHAPPPAPGRQHPPH
jgi:hypothetical protein